MVDSTASTTLPSPTARPERVAPERYAAFVAALVAGQRARCERLVEELVAAGTPVRALYHLFTDALHEIGDRWQRGQIGVVTEHLATAITEALVARVFPRTLARDPLGLDAVVSCAADELHQLGGRIVADVLELRGWNVTFVGAGVPVDALVAEVVARAPRLLALSVSIEAHVPAVHAAIAGVRAAGADPHIVVGGQGVGAAARPALEALPGVVIATSIPELEALLAAWEGP